MKSYFLAYYGEPKFDSPEQASAQKAKWETWVAGLGGAVVDPGTPLGKAKTVSASGVGERGANRLLGFSIVRAAGMEAALEIAKACPYREQGTIEVAEIVRMGP
jgi:hypothetical protein